MIEFKGDQKMSLAVQFAGKCVKLELVACNSDTAAGFTQKLMKAITAINNTKKIIYIAKDTKSVYSSNKQPCMYINAGKFSSGWLGSHALKSHISMHGQEHIRTGS